MRKMSKTLFIYGCIFGLCLSAMARATAADITVTNQTELLQALSNPDTDQTILLETGHYGDLFLYGQAYQGIVTIKAQDQAAPPVFSDIYLNTVSNMRFENIIISGEAVTQPGWGDYMRILSSSNITLRDSVVGGTSDQISDNDDVALNIRGSSSVHLEGNTFHDAFRGVVIENSDDISLLKNGFTEIRIDGMVVAGSQNITLENNLCTNFRPVYDHPTIPDDHADCIQMWNDNQTRENDNVLIRGNIAMRGEGERTQGILISGQQDIYPNSNLLIEHNVIHQSMGQGIFVSNSENVTIRQNSIIAAKPIRDIAQLSLVARSANDLTNVVVENNILSAPLQNIPAQVVLSENAVFSLDDPLNENAASNFIWAPLNTGEISKPSDFMSRTPLGASEYVQSILNFTPASYYIDHTYSLSGVNEVTLKAIESSPTTNMFPVSFIWEAKSADESSYTVIGSGPEITHQFSFSGEASLRLRVTNHLEEGEDIFKTVIIPSTIVIDGAFTTSAFQENSPLTPNVDAAISIETDSDVPYGVFTGQSVANGGGIITYPRSSDLDGMTNLTIDLNLRRASATGNWEAIVERPGTYSIWAKNDIVLARLYVEGRSQPLQLYVPNAGIMTGDWVELHLNYDGQTGTLQMNVDDITIGSISDPAAGDLKTINQYLYLGGNPWNSTFMGHIASFTMRQ